MSQVCTLYTENGTFLFYNASGMEEAVLLEFLVY